MDRTNNNMELLKDGAILLSTETLIDPTFSVTVILICTHNDDGTFGLVINRPSHMPLTEVFESIPEYFNGNRAMYMGGPVDLESLHLIQLTNNGVNESYMVADGVFLGGEWESIEEILTTDPTDTRLFLGYSGWEAGQLENEIKEGSWEIFRVDLASFLKEWSEPLFNDVASIRNYLQEHSITTTA